MKAGETEKQLIRMSDIETEQVKWLWYPFIPYSKITIIQDDPGKGKTSFVLAMIVLLTTGKPFPEEKIAAEPIRVIYQSSEDGLADTIKPRLEMSGADCSRVLVIDESDKELTVCDERLEQAVQETGAKLIVLIYNKARRYTEITELSAELLNVFIEKIEVGERAERYSRTAGQEIVIHYRDIGVFGAFAEEAEKVAEIRQRQTA